MTTERRLILAVVPLLVALAMVVPAWQPAIALVLVLLAANLLPWLVVSLVERFERRGAAVERVTTSGDDITPARGGETWSSTSSGRPTGRRRPRANTRWSRTSRGAVARK